MTVSQERPVESWADKSHSLIHSSAPPSQAGISSDFSISIKRDPLFFEREAHMDSKIPHSGLSLYGQDPGLGGLRSTGSTAFGRTAAPIVTQVHLNVNFFFFLSKHRFELCGLVIKALNLFPLQILIK